MTRQSVPVKLHFVSSFECFSSPSLLKSALVFDQFGLMLIIYCGQPVVVNLSLSCSLPHDFCKLL